MNIISIGFFVFVVVVFFLHFLPFKKNLKSQNWLLLLSSYFLYGYADWKLALVLIAATLIFFGLGIAIHKTENKNISSWYTTLGVLAGVGLLFYFKYFNFFIDSFSSVLNIIGLKSNFGTFNIIMPLGISFFTFKLISYILEVHREKMKPSIDFVSFSTYVAFFPTILSGPIDRPNTFIPQLQNKRSFNYHLTVDGCRQILWGLFQKIVIADNLAVFVNHVWSDIPNQSSTTLIVAAVLYSIQMYTDFSGYSHIAIGVGKILGFRIARNFNYPFFSRNIAEFWRNWHISLTSWLTDYIFMPLNIKFRNMGKSGLILAILITMLAIGMWHGANYTFAIFGLYHGLLYIPLILAGSFFKKKKLKTNKFGLPILKDFLLMIWTFMLVTFGLVIFRAKNIGQALEYVTGICNFSLKSVFNISHYGLSAAVPALFFSALFFVIEWLGREEQFAFSKFGLKWKEPFRYAMYYSIIFAIYWYGGKEQQFIYFQF